MISGEGNGKHLWLIQVFAYRFALIFTSIPIMIVAIPYRFRLETMVEAITKRHWPRGMILFAILWNGHNVKKFDLLRPYGTPRILETRV